MSASPSISGNYYGSADAYRLEVYLNTPRHREPYLAGQKLSERNNALLQELDEHMTKFLRDMGTER